MNGEGSRERGRGGVWRGREKGKRREEGRGKRGVESSVQIITMWC